MTNIRHINRQHIQKLIRSGEIIVMSQSGKKPTLEDFKNILAERIRHDTHKKGDIYGTGSNERNNTRI